MYFAIRLHEVDARFLRKATKWASFLIEQSDDSCYERYVCTLNAYDHPKEIARMVEWCTIYNVDWWELTPDDMYPEEWELLELGSELSLDEYEAFVYFLYWFGVQDALE